MIRQSRSLRGGRRSWILDHLGLKLLSGCLAVFLWAVVLGEQKVEVVVKIPLELSLPPNMVLVNDPPDTLEVRLRGPKTLVTSLPPREVVLSHVPSAFVEGENAISIHPSAIRVPRGIEVVEVDPRRVRVLLEALVRREVEVKPRIEGSPADGFVVKDVSVSPSRVVVVGPRNELRRLTQVSTLPVRLDGHTASFSARVLVEPMERQVRVLDSSPVTVQVDIGPKKS